MKLNKNCIRKVLLYLEEHCVFEIDEYGDEVIHCVSFYELSHSEFLSEFSTGDIRYTICVLLEEHYIIGTLIPEGSGLNFNIARISQLTLQGHELLANIRPETVWTDTKNALAKVGDFSLHIMSQLASDIMAAYIKTIVNI